MPSSNFFRNKCYNAAYRQTNLTAPTAIYLALATTDFTAANSGSGEVSGGSYARQNITAALGAPTNGSGSNTAIVDFGVATGNWGTIAFWGIFDALTVGNLIAYGPMTSSQAVNTGNSARFQIGAIVANVA